MHPEPSICAIASLALALAGLAITWLELQRAQYGFEDDSGFHRESDDRMA